MMDLKRSCDASVIIPTYNRCELLDYTLNSLWLQDLPKGQFEVIVADDGSCDNTSAIVKKYDSLLRIKYLFQDNKGFRVASARNMGIRAAEGEVCIFIDSGILMRADCIADHIQFHLTNKNASVIGYVYGFDQENSRPNKLKRMIHPLRPGQSIDKLAKSNLFSDIRDKHYVRHHHRIHELPAPWIYFWTCHVSVPRAALLRIGMFDEQFDGRWGCEDIELGFRLHRSGIKLHLLRSAKALHYPHSENFKEKKAQGYENCIYFNNKYQTPETKVYLENYRNETLSDINALSLTVQKPILDHLEN